MFRICTLTGLELPLLEQAMKDADYDELSQAALLRLVNSWLPPRIDEIHLNEDGHPVPTELQNWCKDVYDSDVDLNLGGYRSIALLDHFGESQWVDICQHVRDSSLNLLAELPSLKQEQSEVERQATNHFQMVRSRMESRHRANLESELSLQQDLERLELLQNLVVEIIRNPRRRIDAIGLYLLSGAPPEINDPRANRE